MFITFCYQRFVICFAVHISNNKPSIVGVVRNKLRRHRHFAVVLCYAEIIRVTRHIPTVDTYADLVTIQTIADNGNRLACADAVAYRCRNRNFTASQRRYNAVFYRCNRVIRTGPYNFVHIRRRKQRRRAVYFNPVFAACRKLYANRRNRRGLHCHVGNCEYVVSFARPIISRRVPSNKFRRQASCLTYLITARCNRVHCVIIRNKLLHIHRNRIYTVFFRERAKRFTEYVQIRYVTFDFEIEH